MNLGQLEVLVAIVETGSLTEAAEVVGLTQSAVSYSLSKLEAELGVTLLERGRRGVMLTRIGEEIVYSARIILAQTEIIRQKAAHERGVAVGKLRFGCVPTIPARLLTGVLREFQQKYPDVEVVLFEGTPLELVDWISQGVIDIGTVISPEGYSASVPLALSEIVLIVAKDHPLAGQDAVHPSHVHGESLIGPRAEYGILNQMSAIRELPIPTFRYEVSTQSTILSMVREGMGVSLMPKMLFDAEADGVVPLPFTPRLPLRVWLAAQHRSPVVQAFLTEANTWAKSHGYLLDEA